MIDGLKRYNVVLASGSPRRRELLAMLDVDFEVRVPRDVEEVYPADLAIEDVPVYLSRLKAEAYRSTMMRPGDLVIASDTIVAIDGEILGKPADKADAKAMLRKLSGRTHKVVTGVTVLTEGHIDSRADVTEVEFAELTDEEIDRYVEQYAPLDKAGAYGVQEWVGAVGVKRIDGSFYNVMGLPTHLLYSMLERVQNA